MHGMTGLTHSYAGNLMILDGRHRDLLSGLPRFGDVASGIHCNLEADVVVPNVSSAAASGCRHLVPGLHLQREVRQDAGDAQLGLSA